MWSMEHEHKGGSTKAQESLRVPTPGSIVTFGSRIVVDLTGTTEGGPFSVSSP